MSTAALQPITSNESSVPGARQSVLGSSLPYAGRTIDVMAFQGVRRPGVVATLDALLLSPDGGGTACTGIQKLAQRWLVEFCTIEGSIPSLPDRGCDFVRQARRGTIRTTLELGQAFAGSERQVYRNLQSEDEGQDVRADESLDRAELISGAVDAGSISLSVRIHSLAGESREVVFPVDTVVR